MPFVLDPKEEDMPTPRRKLDSSKATSTKAQVAGGLAAVLAGLLGTDVIDPESFIENLVTVVTAGGAIFLAVQRVFNYIKGEW